MVYSAPGDRDRAHPYLVEREAEKEALGVWFLRNALSASQALEVYRGVSCEVRTLSTYKRVYLCP
jgi:hypothetical protein